jgi:hypothetical protein
MCPFHSPAITSVDVPWDVGATPTGSVYEAGSGQIANLGLPLKAPIVGVAEIGDNSEYLVASDGGVFALAAAYWGSMGGHPLNAPIVGMAARNNDGYWLVASDGGVFTFDNEPAPDHEEFYGSMGGRPLNSPIVGIVPTPDYRGYWLVAADGGVFNFGDAGFYGSRGGQPLNSSIVGMASTADGHGYWLVSSDGGIFAYGDAPFFGADLGLGHAVIGIGDYTPGATQPPGPGEIYVPEGYCVATTNGQSYCSN